MEKLNVNAPAFTPSPSADGSKTPPKSPPSHSHSNTPSNRPPRHNNRRSNPKPNYKKNQDRSASRPRESRQRPTTTNTIPPNAPAEPEPVADKKGRVSLNHLLNFRFPERHQTPITTVRKSGRKTTYQPYNKDRFVNANFRFILNPTQDYTIQLADPDAHFEWPAIEQILVADTLTCPICLCPPTAARITKCGHAFCLPCIRHYLQLSDRKWHKCPICWDAVYARDLKPVRTIAPFATNDARLSPGASVRMRLVERDSDATLAFPVSETWPLDPSRVERLLPTHEPLYAWHFMPNALHFARFMLATHDYLEAEYGRDQDELARALDDAKEWHLTSEIPFIEACVAEVQDALAQLQKTPLTSYEANLEMTALLFQADALSPTHKARESRPQAKVAAEKQRAPPVEMPEAYRQHHLRLTGEDHALQIDAPSSSNGNGTGKSNSNSNSNAAPSTTAEASKARSTRPATEFYFYQAADGQHIYLHPLDIKVLKHEYGDYQQFPHELSFVVENVEETTITEEVRKRFKYLGHLPLACDVTFIEIDLKKVVSDETLKTFSREYNFLWAIAFSLFMSFSFY
ncbi:hypothetical protein BCR43DRAFT_496379 [Syncephalastrum racemosum]|uniref:RING-type domain-containing protein n=1 Tax=Syncephalastrum racemosum TaxID=13706 RepID=A0A1X2H405_SYNRA|nr:hypothetical protein BCR43DRAFT_496379 [Syncephalastrum racemosum]